MHGISPTVFPINVALSRVGEGNEEYDAVLVCRVIKGPCSSQYKAKDKALPMQRSWGPPIGCLRVSSTSSQGGEEGGVKGTTF